MQRHGRSPCSRQTRSAGEGPAAALADLGLDARVAGTDVRLGKTLFADIPMANMGSDALAGFSIIIDNPRKRWRLAAAGSNRPLLETRPPRRQAPQPS